MQILRPLQACVCALILPLAGVLGAQTVVVPPPLPVGSSLVRVEGGLDETERKRHVRAHHHKFHHKKDYTRDDTVHGEPGADVPLAGSSAPGVVNVLTPTTPQRAAGGPAAPVAARCDDQAGKSRLAARAGDVAAARHRNGDVAGQKTRLTPQQVAARACEVRAPVAGQEKGSVRAQRKDVAARHANSGSTR